MGGCWRERAGALAEGWPRWPRFVHAAHSESLLSEGEGGLDWTNGN